MVEPQEVLSTGSEEHPKKLARSYTSEMLFEDDYSSIVSELQRLSTSEDSLRRELELIDGDNDSTGWEISSVESAKGVRFAKNVCFASKQCSMHEALPHLTPASPISSACSVTSSDQNLSDKDSQSGVESLVYDRALERIEKMRENRALMKKYEMVVRTKTPVHHAASFLFGGEPDAPLALPPVEEQHEANAVVHAAARVAFGVVGRSPTLGLIIAAVPLVAGFIEVLLPTMTEELTLSLAALAIHDAFQNYFQEA